MEIERRILKSTWGYNGNLEPLCEVEDRDDEILVTFDLPRVIKENVEVNTTENTVEVIAKMSNAVAWDRWGVVQKKITFQSFRKQIRLPEPLEPEKARASLRNGILMITLPKQKHKVLIRIE